MPSVNALSARVRSAAARTIDPYVVARAQTLVRRGRRAAGTPGLSDLIDRIGDDTLRDFQRVARRGTLTAEQHAYVHTLVTTHLAQQGADANQSMIDAICSAFESFYQPLEQPAPLPSPRVVDAIVNSFHRLYYNTSLQTWRNTFYRGTTIYKCPTDMWIYQEIVDELRPGLIIETGTWQGGSALFLADRLDIADHGEIVSIDIDPQPDLPSHDRLTYLRGSSIDTATLEEVRRRLPGDGSPVLVILDSDHSRDHVAAELLAYAPMVTVGSFLIVEDTNVNGHPTELNFGPGPWEAAQEFVRDNAEFEIDRSKERYFLTQNPSGFLRRIS